MGIQSCRTARLSGNYARAGRFAPRFIRNQVRRAIRDSSRVGRVSRVPREKQYTLQTSRGRKSSFAITEINSVSTTRISRTLPPRLSPPPCRLYTYILLISNKHDSFAKRRSTYAVEFVKVIRAFFSARFQSRTTELSSLPPWILIILYPQP